MFSICKYFLPLPILILAACTSEPTGPDVAVSPGYGKSYNQFNDDDVVCRHYASDQVSGTVQQGNDSAIKSGVVGTAIGAVAGGIIGGGRGAAVGAGTGLVVGSAVGANSSQNAGNRAQRNYDGYYQQCMYARGNNVPGWGGRSSYPPPPPRPPGY